MIALVEKRLATLENTLKALKASYPTSGSNARLYVTKATFDVSISNETTIQIKFTPQYGQGKILMATAGGTAIKLTGTGLYTFWGAHQAIQDGSGNVIIKFPFLNEFGSIATDIYRLSVVISATSPGTFTQL